jgi:hypothetical protein
VFVGHPSSVDSFRTHVLEILGMSGRSLGTVG